jgi:hypothetical protein
MPMKIFIPFFFTEQIGAPSWLPSCTTEGPYIIVTLRHFIYITV